MSARTSLSGAKRSGTNNGNMTLAMNRTVIKGTPRTNSMKVIEASRTAGMSERQQNAERQRGHDSYGCDDDSDENAAPQRGRHVGQADHRHPAQKNVRKDRQHDEEIDGAEIAARRAEPGQPGYAEREQHEEQIDAPALAYRIEAVDEIGGPYPHESPARAGFGVLLRRQAGLTIRA